MSPTSRSRARRSATAAVARVVILVLALLLASACSVGKPRPVGPAGVDGLEIPTPSPDPGDFVEEIDNPFLPLAPGSVWTYRTDDGRSTTVSVSRETRTVAGVTVTEVTTLVAGAAASPTAGATAGPTAGPTIDPEPDAAGPAVTTELFAQDRDGNVWSFGGDDWTAGVDGAQAGLVMPAVPRVGDGFRQQYAAGVAEDRSEVLDTAAVASTEFGSWTGVVEVLETSGVGRAGEQGEPALPSEVTRYYAPGVGLVLSETSTSRAELVAYEGPDPAA